MTVGEKVYDASVVCERFPALGRKQNGKNVVHTAFLLAAIDVASVANNANHDELRREIRVQSVQVDTVPEGLKRANDLASGMSLVACQIDTAEHSILVDFS